MGFMFEDLEVYKRSLALAERITKLTGEFSSGSYAIADQLRRAAISVPCNIAEGNGRWHGKERIRFFYVARGSLHECAPLLDLAKNTGHLDVSEHSDLRAELIEIGKMLAGLIRKEKEREKKRRAAGKE